MDVQPVSSQSHPPKIKRSSVPAGSSQAGEAALGINSEFAAKKTVAAKLKRIDKSPTYDNATPVKEVKFAYFETSEFDAADAVFDQCEAIVKSPAVKRKTGKNGDKFAVPALSYKPQEKREKSPEEIAKEKQVQKEWWDQFRYAMHQRLRAVLLDAGLYGEMKSLINCGCYPIPAYRNTKDGDTVATGHPGNVVTSLYPASRDQDGNIVNKARLGFAHVQRCGNANLCFMDAPKIRYYRSQELRKITSVMLHHDFEHLFLTYTAPHDVSTDPVEFVDKFNDALRWFKSYARIDGYRYADIKEEFGLSYNVTTREMTCDNPMSKHKSGVHYHAHQLMFVEKKWENKHKMAEKFYTIVSNRWVECLIHSGLIKSDDDATVTKALKFMSATSSPAFKVDLPRYRKDIKRTLNELIEYLAKGAGIELSPGIFTKNGRLPSRINHWTQIVLALTKYPNEVPTMINVVRALKAHSWMSFSRGLRKFCDLEDVQDDDILQGKVEIQVAEVEKEDWIHVGSNSFQYDLRASVVKDCKKHGANIDNIAIDEDGQLKSGLVDFRDLEKTFYSNVDFIIIHQLSPLTHKPRDLPSLLEIMKNQPCSWKDDDP